MQLSVITGIANKYSMVHKWCHTAKNDIYIFKCRYTVQKIHESSITQNNVSFQNIIINISHFNV